MVSFTPLLLSMYVFSLAFNLAITHIKRDFTLALAFGFTDSRPNLATTMKYHAKEPAELIGPAVAGTVGILKSITNNA